MGFFSSEWSEKDEAKAREETARVNLHHNAEEEQRQGIDYETPRYQRLNHEYNEAVKNRRGARGR